jgi:ABC-2 type transport system ATP-binding protein
VRIVETESLTRRFGDLTAVDDFSLTVDAGETFGLLGPNGAGKTTVIKMLTTLLPVTEGTARVAGFDIQKRPNEVRRSIGYVPQILSADGTLTGYENLLVFARLYDIPAAERLPRIREALKVMGLVDAADRLVRTYSGGMIRRLEIAQSMIHRPRLLFLDEPTVGLDPLARNAVWDYIRRLRTEFGMTIFLTTHYMEEAEELCDRVAIMHLGRIAALGTPKALEEKVAAEVGPNGHEHSHITVNENGITLNDVFAHYTGGELDSGGNYRDTSRVRRTARRLG